MATMFVVFAIQSKRQFSKSKMSGNLMRITIATILCLFFQTSAQCFWGVAYYSSAITSVTFETYGTDDYKRNHRNYNYFLSVGYIM